MATVAMGVLAVGVVQMVASPCTARGVGQLQLHKHHVIAQLHGK